MFDLYFLTAVCLYSTAQHSTVWHDSHDSHVAKETLTDHIYIRCNVHHPYQLSDIIKGIKIFTDTISKFLTYSNLTTRKVCVVIIAYVNDVGRTTYDGAAEPTDLTIHTHNNVKLITYISQCNGFTLNERHKIPFSFRFTGHK